MRYRYKTQQWIPYPIELVFAFFANPHNLPSLMKKWQSMRLEEATIVPPPPRPIAPDPAYRVRTVAAGRGSSLTFSYRPFPYSPVRLPWESSITQFAWNESFTDLAVRSPFPYWEHLHSFEVETRANAAGILVQGTLAADDPTYTPPLNNSRMSRLLHDKVIHRIIHGVFQERQKKLAAILPVVLGRIIPLSNEPPTP
ncbi:MAG: cyclase [Acidobacteriaceae bacterium]|nr:cyclase [Acidobacteriaceae bacterium]